jgi:hypothetical protein
VDTMCLLSLVKGQYVFHLHPVDICRLRDVAPPFLVDPMVFYFLCREVSESLNESVGYLIVHWYGVLNLVVVLLVNTVCGR